MRTPAEMAAQIRELLTENELLKAAYKAMNEELTILRARDENRGEITRGRGASIFWHMLGHIKPVRGVITFYFADALKFLERSPDDDLRIRKTVRNPYKLIRDTVKWVKFFAKNNGYEGRLRIEKGEIGKKLKCFRFYVGIEPPQDPEEGPQEAPQAAQSKPQGKSKGPGKIRQMEAWAAGYVGFSRVVKDEAPGG